MYISGSVLLKVLLLGFLIVVKAVECDAVEAIKKKKFRVVLRDIEDSVYCLPFENSMMFQVSQRNFYQSLLFYQRKAIKSSCVPVF